MGVLRIIRYGTEFSFRTRRIFFFIIFFIALTGITLYAMNEVSRENTDQLILQKVVILRERSPFSASVSDANVIAQEFNVRGNYVYVMRYIYISSLKMKIFSADLSQPWSNNIVKPDEIRSGSYLSTSSDIGNNTFQALASRNLITLGNITGSNTVQMFNTYSVGSVQSFTKSSESFNLKIVGLYDKKLDLPINENWLIVPDKVFDGLVSFLGVSQTSIYAYQIVVVAQGYSETLAGLILGSSISNINKNNLLAQPINQQSQYFSLYTYPHIDQVQSQATSTDLILLIGLIGSPIVATMYAFMISRFRTREMAVLKAVGYSNRNVQIMILTEIAVVSIIGFLISVFGLQIILALNSEYTLNTTYVPLIWNPFVSLIPSGTTITTFIFVVLSNIVGFFIISYKTIRVQPVELFKNVG